MSKSMRVKRLVSTSMSVFFAAESIKLLARYDVNLTFVQTWDGVPLSQKYPISEFNRGFCDLSRDYVSSGVDTNY